MEGEVGKEDGKNDCNVVVGNKATQNKRKQKTVSRNELY